MERVQTQMHGRTASWKGVELRHLAALAAVAREGSFREAAEALGYVQSAVSQQVANLEKVVGHRLIDRQSGTGPVALTPAGELMLSHTDQIMARLGAAQVDLAVLAEASTGVLRVGSGESASTRLMPRILRALDRETPAVNVAISEADRCSELLELLRRGDLEACFCRSSRLSPSFASVLLFAEPIVLIVPAESAPGTTSPIEPEQLAGLELVRHAMMEDLEPQLRALGVVPRYKGASERNTAVQAWVGAGVASAVVPALAVDYADPNIVAYPLEHMLVSADFRLAWQRGRRLPEAFGTFLALARKVGEAIGTELAPPTPVPFLAHPRAAVLAGTHREY